MPYSPLKIIHHRDRLDQLSRGKQIVPTQVQLIISDLCNQDCGFCAYRMSGYTSNQLFSADTGELASFGTNNPNRMIPYDKVIEILDDCVEMGVKAIQFTGGGEPTVHPKHADIFKATIDRGLDLALVTNGAVIREQAFPALLQAKWIRFSLDSGTPETYASVRRVDSKMYHRVWENIRRFVRDRQIADQIIGVGFVVTKENWKEVVDCVWKARDVGVNNVRISAVFQSDDENYFRDFYDQAADVCRTAEKYSTPEFKVFNNFGDRVGDLAQHSPDYAFCGYQQFNTYIGGDMTVYRCCNTAYNAQGVIGSLVGQRFKDLWKSEQKKHAIESFDARGCERCMFNNKNRVINYALESDPAHINFV